MKKDAYYFPHFIGARNDHKILNLRQSMGIEGYGIYFMLLEVLRSQTDYKFPKSQIGSIVYDFHCSKIKLMRVLNDFDLFQVDEQNNFYSQRLIDYLKPYLEKSQRAKDAINKRWGNTKEDSFVSTNEYTKEIQNYQNSDTINKLINKEIKKPPNGGVYKKKPAAQNGSLHYLDDPEYWKKKNEEISKLNLNKKD